MADSGRRHGDSGSRRHHHHRSSSHNAERKRRKPSSGTRRGTSTHALSIDALAQFNATSQSGYTNSNDNGDEAVPRQQRQEREERQERQQRRERRERRESRARSEEQEERQERRQKHERRERHESRTRSEERRRRRRKEERLEREREQERERERMREIEVVEYNDEVVEEERPTRDRRQKYYYIDHEDDRDDDSYNHPRDGYDRVEADSREDRRHRKRRDRRIPSGAVLEEGRSRGVKSSRWTGHLRGGFGGLSSSSSNNTGNSILREKEEQLYYTKQLQTPKWSKKKKMLIFGGIGAGLLVLLIVVVAVVVSKKNGGGGGSGSGSGTSGLGSISPGSIPSGAPSWLDPYSWADTTDFNLTYTDATVGGLPVMGLNTSYDDSKSANSKTAPLNKPWGSYGTTPARGVNLGGWLSLEPFITPSLFNYDLSLGIIDEWTLCSYLGPAKCSTTLENHYATFVTESTFAEIAAAGLDHVRIPYSYWAVEVYEGDPYLFRTSWRYLLRGIEWARKHGLRVNLDLHGLPGSQNGWNHSGRQGAIGWMNGTDGDLNVQRSLDVHDKLSQFFAQPRYANVLSHYGLANEPRMTFLSIASVMNWTQTTAALVRQNGVSDNTIIVFGDGFCGLSRWQGQPNTHNLALDVHQYEIFNNGQIVYNHTEKINYACTGWTQQTQQSMNTATGFGPTIVAEWSQADTDCATYLGNVGNGNRWTGTYNVGNASLNALTPMCPLTNASCSCAQANASPTTYSSDYKQFLLMFAEAQMYSFEKGWGWWYWTWDTETATQWSYKKGLAAGILPANAAQRSFQCDLGQVPSFSNLPEYY